nr:MAG TPA: hypothetical protein [Caudoviricetes sp.]
MAGKSSRRNWRIKPPTGGFFMSRVNFLLQFLSLFWSS